MLREQLDDRRSMYTSSINLAVPKQAEKITIARTIKYQASALGVRIICIYSPLINSRMRSRTKLDFFCQLLGPTDLNPSRVDRVHARNNRNAWNRCNNHIPYLSGISYTRTLRYKIFSGAIISNNIHFP